MNHGKLLLGVWLGLSVAAFAVPSRAHAGSSSPASLAAARGASSRAGAVQYAFDDDREERHEELHHVERKAEHLKDRAEDKAARAEDRADRKIERAKLKHERHEAAEHAEHRDD